MNNETLKQLQKEIHAMAVSKGWWEGERNTDEIFANIHSEISEAWEEFRNGSAEPEIYFEGEMLTVGGKRVAKCYPACMEQAAEWADKGGKPEGIPIELSDCVIRILDAAEALGWDVRIERYGETYETFASLICSLHGHLTDAWDCGSNGSSLTQTLEDITTWLKENGLDLEQTIRLKMAYNATRPYRHGGKKA